MILTVSISELLLAALLAVAPVTARAQPESTDPVGGAAAIDSVYVSLLERWAAAQTAGREDAAWEAAESIYRRMLRHKGDRRSVSADSIDSDREALLQLVFCEQPLRITLWEACDVPLVLFGRGLPDSVGLRCLDRALEIVPILFPGSRDAAVRSHQYNGREFVTLDVWIVDTARPGIDLSHWDALTGGWPDAIAIVDVERGVMRAAGRRHGYADLCGKCDGEWRVLERLWLHDAM